MPTMLLIFGSLALAFWTAERLFPHRRQPACRSGFWADALYVPVHFGMRVVVNGILAIWIVAAGKVLLPDYAVAVLEDSPILLQAFILLITLDFVFYVTHRLKHRWRWWWRLHETHHSSEELDFFSTVRFHPLEKLLDRVIYLVPLLVLGPSPSAVLIWASVDAFMGMLIHSNLNIRLGPLIYIFVGPEMHRWHHCRDARYHGCNFGNNFSIFDWIFGTAQLPQGEPTGYGIDEEDYPHENIGRQFLYAFRPFAAPRKPLACAPSDESRGLKKAA